MRFVGFLLISVLVAACGRSAGATPAWPKQAEKEVDGGESLEPRTASAVAAVDDDDEEEEVVEVKAVEKPAEKPAAVEAKPATPPPAPTPEPITTEEIVIEIEDD